MTTPIPPTGGTDGGQGARRPIASYGSYEEAQRAVDFLSDRHFPVEQVAIVGHDLEWVEQVTGRLTTARAALQGALQGAFIGLLFGLLFGLFFTSPRPYLALLLYGLVVGAIFGAVFGAIGHAAMGGERDFSAVGAMRANRYEILADHEVADEAARLLAELPAGGAAAGGSSAAASAPGSAASPLRSL
jgi:hypothetical protein